MTPQKWNQIVDLWNAGNSIDEIARRTGLPANDLGKTLFDSIEKNVRIRSNVTGRR
ncbi:MAG: hypothetical protein KTR19_09905 [Hyphomicrobiales bacterium]|nr:hypothetical protein [Hyphomicrobiales bacterium]